jgi:hypothetical protein
MTGRSPHVLGALALTVLVGCSSDSTTNPNGPPGNGGREIKASPSFAQDIQEIFNRIGCNSSSCHGATPAGGLDLRSGNSHAALVGVRSTNEPSQTRVIAGNAQGSYLVIKLEGRQQVGTQMPQGRGTLDNIDLTNIRNWIDQGAAND